MVPAPMAGVAVPADPPPGGDGLVLLRLGELGEVPDLRPRAALLRIRDDVGCQPDRVLAVWRVDGIGGVAVGDEDLEAPLHPGDIGKESTVDLLSREVRDRHETAAPGGPAEVVTQLE